MNLHPCPLCGESKGYMLDNGDTYRWWNVQCRGCGRTVDECTSDRRTAFDKPLPDSWPAADEAWNCAAAHAQGLRERIKVLEAQRVPLTDERMRDAYMTTNTRTADQNFGAFRDGVRFAERAHGIEEVKTP